MKLTRFERELKKAYEAGQFEEVKLTKAEREKFREAARLSIAKRRSITIRINPRDLEELQMIAFRAGKKYQTYLGELIHDHVVKKRKAA